MPDVAAAENPSQLAPPEPGLRHRLPHRSAGSADRIPAGTTANAGPIEPTTLGRDRHRGGGHPPTPATPPCVRVRTRRFETVTESLGMRGACFSLPGERSSPTPANTRWTSIGCPTIERLFHRNRHTLLAGHATDGDYDRLVAGRDVRRQLHVQLHDAGHESGGFSGDRP